MLWPAGAESERSRDPLNKSREPARYRTRVAVEEGKVPSISVEAYVLVKYGQRIPDLAWDVQEKIKANLERYTGYTVSSVNINVQGIYSDRKSVV